MSGGKVYWWWPLAQVEIGPIWIATYRMDEYPLRYVSETKWMDFHIRKGCMSTFSHSWMTTSFGWKLRASFEWSLAEIHEVHGSDKTMWQCVNERDKSQWIQWEQSPDYKWYPCLRTRRYSRSSWVNVISYSKSGKDDILHQVAMLA